MVLAAVRNRPPATSCRPVLAAARGGAPAPAQSRPSAAKAPAPAGPTPSRAPPRWSPWRCRSTSSAATASRCRGLTADDFEIYDGSSRRRITSFEVVDLKTPASRRPARGPRRSAAGRRRRDLPAGARRHFLLLFDLSFSSPTSILKARLAARDFVLNSLHPTDLAAVATYSLESGPQAGRHLHPRPRRSSRGPSTPSATASPSTRAAPTRCAS